VPIRHEVKQGDSVISLSERHGHFAVTIWDDPANAELKKRRENMNALMPGDPITIPDKRPKEVSKPATQRHTFRRKGIPATLFLRLFNGQTERANQDYTIKIEGQVRKGTTDATGLLNEFVPPKARSCTIIIGPEKSEFELLLGHMDPHDEISGIQKRLTNLGFDCGEATGEMNAKTSGAIRNFQITFDLEPTGLPDEATVEAIRSQHDEQCEFPPEESGQTSTPP